MKSLAATDRSLTRQAFQAQFQDLYTALNGVNKLLLRRYSPRQPKLTG